VRASVPYHFGLTPFETDLSYLVRNIKFRNVRNILSRSWLKHDAEYIDSSNLMFVSTD